MSDSELVPVVQADVTEADKAAVTTFQNKQIKRIIAGDRTLGENRDCIEQAFARHRIAAEAASEAQVKVLREALEELRGILEDAPELNPSNYDHDQVCELNAKMVEAYLFLTALSNTGEG